MISRLLYTYKKLKLAIVLARFDLLFLLNGLSSFQTVISPVGLFVKPSVQTVFCRIRNFLASRRGFVPDLMASEMAALALSRGALLYFTPGKEKQFQGGSILRAKSRNLSGIAFYQRLLRELVEKDFPQYPEVLADFNLRLNLSSDMRLYAAELAEFLKASADSPQVLPLDVDWVKTSEDELYLESAGGFYTTLKLTPVQQQNLVQLFAYLLFEKSVFVSDWQMVAVDSEDRVIPADFDHLYSATYVDKLFAFSFSHEMAESLNQLKLQRALLLLCILCPKVKVADVFAMYRETFRDNPPASITDTADAGQSPHLRYDLLTTQPIYEALPPDSILKRLQNKRYEKVSWLDRSGILYWGPAAITGIILFMLFRA